MTEAKHTPGNWKSTPIYPMSATSSGHVTVHEEMGISYYGVMATFQDGQDRRCSVAVGQASITKGRDGEAEANARLIAAAPDMLNALKAVADFYSWTDETAVAATPRQVLNAIAKAEGR